MTNFTDFKRNPPGVRVNNYAGSLTYTNSLGHVFSNEGEAAEAEREAQALSKPLGSGDVWDDMEQARFRKKHAQSISPVMEQLSPGIKDRIAQGQAPRIARL